MKMHGTTNPKNTDSSCWTFYVNYSVMHGSTNIKYWRKMLEGGKETTGIYETERAKEEKERSLAQETYRLF
jgi:hypothetical protein